MDLESLPAPFLADLVRMDPEEVQMVSKRFLEASAAADSANVAISARRFVTSPARYELALAMTARGSDRGSDRGSARGCADRGSARGSADGIRKVAVAAACASAARGDPTFLWYFTRKFADAHRRAREARRGADGDLVACAAGKAEEIAFAACAAEEIARAEHAEEIAAASAEFDREAELAAMWASGRDAPGILADCLRHLDDRLDFLGLGLGSLGCGSCLGLGCGGGLGSLGCGGGLGCCSGLGCQKARRDSRVRQLALSAACSGSTRVLAWLKANRQSGLALAVPQMPGWSKETVQWLLDNYWPPGAAEAATAAEAEAAAAAEAAPSQAAAAVQPSWASMKADAAESGSFGAWRLLDGVAEVPPCRRAATGGCDGEFGGSSETHRACAACRIAAAQAAGTGIFENLVIG